MKPFTKLRTGNDVQIVLGDGWKRFAFTGDALDYLGTIRRGMEIGALAKDAEGNYWQVNGDIRQVLNASRVAAHLRRARAQREPRVAGRQPIDVARAAVVVVIKPRRRVLMPQA